MEGAPQQELPANPHPAVNWTVITWAEVLALAQTRSPLIIELREGVTRIPLAITFEVLCAYNWAYGLETDFARYGQRDHVGVICCTRRRIQGARQAPEAMYMVVSDGTHEANVRGRRCIHAGCRIREWLLALRPNGYRLPEEYSYSPLENAERRRPDQNVAAHQRWHANHPVEYFWG